MTNPELDIHDMIRELTTTHTHREPYVREREIAPGVWVGDGERHHSSDAPSLVCQLIGSTDQTNGTGDEGGTTPRSKPAARIEALDALMFIDDGAGEWIDRLGGIIPADPIDPETMLGTPAAGTIARLMRLHGLEPAADTCGRDDIVEHQHTPDETCFRPGEHPHSKDDEGGWCCQRGRLQHDIRRWWYHARIITGWDSPPFRPNATCTVCDALGTLRVKIGGASCVECHSLWTANEVLLLAEHIRLELERRDAERIAARKLRNDNLRTLA